QLAGEVGGRGYIGDHNNDARILQTDALINTSVLEAVVFKGIKKVFYASSGCVYSSVRLEGKIVTEADAIPAAPDNAFAWGKLFVEQLYAAYVRCYNIDVQIGRYFNCYGSGLAWSGGREKVIGALCRKVAEAKDGDAVEIWGDGMLERTFLYVDDACRGTLA